MTLTLCFCLLPWYNPFNDHMTQYDLDVTSICLVFWCDFMWIIYQTSFWKLDHRVDTTETSMMKPTFQSRWAETHGIEYLQGGQQKPGSWSWLLGDFWNFQFQDSMKWSWRFLINIYIYISCFFKKNNLFPYFPIVFYTSILLKVLFSYFSPIFSP